MSRRQARELTLHMIFAGDYGEDTKRLTGDYFAGERFEDLASEYEMYDKLPAEAQKEYINRAITGVMEHAPELDGYIEKYSKGWNVGRISRITKCILRLSMYEIMYMDIPVGASVDEALELAKKYDNDDAAAFVNGVLGTFVRQEVK